MHRKILLNDANAPFVLKGLRSPSIKEPAIEICLHEKAIGSFQALEVYERVSELNRYPQTIADIVSNMYLRLTYQKPDGTSGTFGTSIIGAISVRTADGNLLLVPQVASAIVHVGNPHRLKIVVSGVYQDFARISSIRTYATEASIYQTTMQAEISLTALKDIHLDQSRLGSDSFRFFSISSMYTDPLHYDGNVIRYKTTHGEQSLELGSIQKRGRYLLSAARRISEIQVVKELGSTGKCKSPGSPDSPSIRAQVLSASVPIEELGIQGYLADSMNINDDSLSVWLEWAACPRVIPKGQEIWAKIEFSAIPPSE